MRTRVKSESNILASVQTFSSLAQMKFKPISQQGTAMLNQRKDQLIKNKKQTAELYDPVSMVLQADRKIENSQPRRLKFLVSLSADHFIVGNQNQIDMIGFGGIVHNFVDTDFYWSFSLKTPIESISVDIKKSVMLILSETTIYFYQYTIKSKELPVLISQYSVKQGVKFIRFLKDTLLGIFYSSSFEIYNIENLAFIKKKLDKAYSIESDKKLLTIPPSIDNIINVFFEEPKEKKQSFILWCLEINFQSEHIKTRPLYRVYDIMNYAKGKLSIQNYTKDIIFMNLNHQIMAIKNGYLIDTVNLSVKDDGQILKYIHPNTILHVTKKTLQVYNFFIDMSVKPEKISLRSIDSIQFTKIPENVFYISILKTFHNNFAIFFQDSNKKQFQTRGQITYYFQISQDTSFKDKISSLFDTIGSNINNPEIVSEKFNIALKMGLSEKEIYVHLWNNSEKTSLEDYQYILATKDYKIIKGEIQKKLKKQSMVLRQILRIEESCHEINKQLVESSSCTEQNIKDYICSHFLLKKLRLFKQIKVLNRLSLINPSDLSEGTNEGKQLKIDIQQYYHYKNVEMRTYLIDQINDMLFNLKNNAKIIRTTIKIFKFVFRLVYKQILNQIIINAKDSLIDLLNELPELLPYFHSDLTEEEIKQGLYEGVWGNVQEVEWEKELYPKQIETIHNKQALSEFMKSVWFKRFWLTFHGCTYRSRQSVIEMNEFNNSDKIFYFFISKLYEHSKNNKPEYYQTIHFLEEKYELFPAHLKGKALLYEHLYIYYFNQEQNNPSRLSFQAFLDWDDELLFKYFFDHEKIKKNSLLRQIKPIYEQTDVNGAHLFNIGLFSYFYSQRSEISDLKFILNRINNEKMEFHLKNKGIYEVLIKSIQFKFRLGSGQDIPMDQIMIYVQNIMLEEEQILQEIQIMQNIKSEAKLFQQMKINMTIKQIMDNFESVTTKIIQFKLNSQLVMTTKQYDTFRKKSVDILQEVERIKNKIYIINEDTNYTLLVYLSFILQDQSFIDFVARLLQDEMINNLFEIQSTTIQNIVLYMYKWRFSKSNKYKDHSSYLKKLLELLPSDNQCRNYLDHQLEIGLILSSEEIPFEYPLSKDSHHPNSEVIRECFKAQNKEFLLALDLEKLHSFLKKLQFFNVHSDVSQKTLKETLSLHTLYQLIIVQLLEKQAFKEVIDYIYKILDLSEPVQNIGIIYVALFIYKTAKQFNEQSRKCIFKLLAMFFNHPRTLMKAIEVNIKSEQTSLEKTSYLKAIIDQEHARSTFNYHNDSILKKEFTCYHQDPNSKVVIEAYRQYLKSKSQEFQRKYEYDLIFTLLCISPYKLIKFIELEKKNLKLKQIYNFIMMTITRPIFQRRKSLEVAKRIFAALFMCSKNIKNCDELMASFESKTTDEQFQIPKLSKLKEKDQKLYKMAKSFAKAQTKWVQSNNQEKEKEKQILEVKAAMNNPNLVGSEPLEMEEDENNYLEYSGNENEISVKGKINKIDFDFPKEMRIFFFRTVPFSEFLVKEKEEKPEHELSLIKKHTAAPIVTLKSAKKDSNYLNTRNKIIEHLYSHKVVVAGSEYHDDGTRKDDQDFLDSFLPKPGSRSSQLSVSSSRGRKSSSSQSRNKSRKKNTLNESIQLPRIKEKKVTIVDSDLLEMKQVRTESNVNPEDKRQTPNVPNQAEKHENLREHLVKSYNEIKIPKFDITPLEDQMKQIQNSYSNEHIVEKKKEEFFHEFLAYLYNQPLEILNLNLKLMEEIGRKHPESGVNIFFLQAYERVYATHTKHGFDMGIAELLPLEGIYVKSKNIVDLYNAIEPHITAKITDENIFKLSKLIALGFRKSIVEQEILYKYLTMTMARFIESDESQLKEIQEKIKGIIQKLQVPTILENGENLFKSLKLGERRSILLENYMEILKNKGYNSAAKELHSKVN